MARQVLSRSMILEILGKFLISGGIVLLCFLGTRLVRERVDDWIAQKSSYLLIGSTPVFELPPATPLPTLTPTSLPTVKPPPLPAVRLSIPAIHLNTSIREMFPVEVFVNGASQFAWEPPAFVAGHYDSSGYPGGGRNIVLAGHNNTLGEIFRHLDQLSLGDEVILFTEANEFHYQVEKKFMFPYSGDEEEGNVNLKFYSAPQTAEMVTLISCWPYVTNSHRIVIIAVPLAIGDANGS